ncbi:glycosyltransferase family 1 protein [Shewanella waksmanii]|uniref:glycosyltransferase family 1 protein n=1 Tax=Shewanella waksmanii TaxID=213783 RepID=UPI00048CECF3|nr:glycosyltransferase family 1 protein [Shewanella waksmanii]
MFFKKAIKDKDKDESVMELACEYDLSKYIGNVEDSNNGELLSFCEEHYLVKNSDVAASDISPFEHYLKYGVYEERYGSKQVEDTLIEINKLFGFATKLKLIHLYVPSLFIGVLNFDTFKKSIRPYIDKIFYQPYYEKITDCSFNNKAAAVNHYINESLEKGVSATPAFNAQFYRKNLERYFGSVPLSDEYLFIHWLLIGNFFDVNCCELLGTELYKDLNSDLKKAKKLSFSSHFVCHGVFENRQFNANFHSRYYLRANGLPSKESAVLHYLTFGSHETAFHPDIITNHLSKSDGETPLQTITQIEQNALNQFNTDCFKEILRRAEEIEPGINNKPVTRELVYPGLKHAANDFYLASKQLQMSLSKKRYKAIVAIPHCRMSGAARVAANLCHALATIYKPSELLLVRTDGHEMQKPDWFPSGIDSLNFFELCSHLGAETRKKLLVELLRGVKVNNFYNVNSRLGWDIIEKYGNQLKESIDLYSYYFCKDRNMDGKKVGYPEMYFCSTFPCLKNIFVDSDFLRNSFIEQHALSGKFADKIITLHSPLVSGEVDFVQAKTRADITKGQASHRQVAFWAGRLDRQKRFDIVLDIAKTKPDLEIWFWGKAVLDKVNYLDDLPSNLKYMGEYESFSELPLLHCDFWLYTSEWDGIPTILLDIANYGIPLISANVEGITDLLDKDNAWPVNDYLVPDAYIAEIEALQQNPQLGVNKALKLKEKVLSAHSMELYNNKLQGLTHVK